MGDYGYTGAAISEWERGKSQVNKDNRAVLTALIKVLVMCRGLKTSDEANSLLIAGNFRRLDELELAQIFPEGMVSKNNTAPTAEIEDVWQLVAGFLRELFHRPKDFVRTIMAKEANDPLPHWSEFFLRVLGWLHDHWSSEISLRAVGWIAVWLLTWRLTFPLIDWPVSKLEDVATAVTIYLVGAIILPLLIGLLTSTRKNSFWQQQSLTTRNLRMFTHQGALVGFHVGYTMVFAVFLLGYYAGFRDIPTSLTMLAAAWPVIVGYAAARQVPLNLLRAFDRLHFQDGAIFFVFILFGPLFGLFWGFAYPYLLAPPVGVPLLLGGAAILAGLMSWQKYRTGESILPAHVWVGVLGTVLVAQQAVSGAGLLGTVILAGLILTIFVLLMREQIHFTLTGLVGFVLVLGLLVPIVYFNRWLGGWRIGRIPSHLVALGTGLYLVPRPILAGHCCHCPGCLFIATVTFNRDMGNGRIHWLNTRITAFSSPIS